MTATAAMMPECMLQNIAQAQRKPAAGDSVSLRNTYTPPVLGYADASSAQMSAPTTVRRPATIHASRSPGIDGNAPLISDGWTKIEAPIIVPTTIAVVWGSLSAWRSWGPAAIAAHRNTPTRRPPGLEPPNLSPEP